MSLHLLTKTLFSRKVATALLLLQLAMTLALLVNSLLLAAQTRQQLNQPTGMDLAQILQVQLKPTTAQLRQYPALGDLLEKQLAAVAAMPGVEAVAYTNQSPVQQGGNNGNVFVVGDQERSNIPMVPLNFVSKDFFKVLGLTLISGELPQQTFALDGPQTPPMVLTKSLAEKLLSDKAVPGAQLSRGPLAAIVSDFYGQRSAAHPMFNSIQVAKLYSVDWGYSLLIRTDAAKTEQVRQQLATVLRQVESNLEIMQLKTLAERYQELYQSEFGLATLLSLLTALMLLVSMISSYSNSHFHVLKRQHEIGIKRALGASKQMIFIELLSENWLCTLLGAGLGILAAMALNQALAQVISMPPLQLWLPLLTTLVLMCCVTLATWYPARIATQVAPATATKTM